MSRKAPEGNVPPVVPIEKSGYVTQIRKYKLITPLFGGGEETQKADSVTTVRATEVRGLLRFWWRATRGGEFDGNLDEMKKREDEIWGSSAGQGKPGPSDVKIKVKVINIGVDDHPFEVAKNKKNKLIIKSRDGSIVPAYAAFPLQPKKDELIQVGQQTAAVKVGVEFLLEISYPTELEKDIQSSLWAWEIFGGIGGRTRRGFGALQLTENMTGNRKEAILPFDYENVEDGLRKGLREHVPSGKWHDSIPHLSRELTLKVIKPINSSANQAWKDLILQYQAFRQRRNKRLGISLWPEANELRRRLGKALNWPKEIENPKLVRKFPRAVFGLPILMHLPHDGDLTFTVQGKSDVKTEKKFERLASILILKPLPCANGKYVGLAAILDGPTIPPLGLEIKEAMDNKEPVEWKLTKDEAKSVPINKVLNNGQTDALQAFLDFLK